MISLTLFENAITHFEHLDDSVIDDIFSLSRYIKDNLGLSDLPIKFVNKNDIYVDGIVSNISINDTNIKILPKFINKNENNNNALKVLFYRTLKCAGNALSKTIYFSKESMISGQELLLEALAKYYISELQDAINKISIMNYETCESKRYDIKGQILFDKTFSDPKQDLKIWCRYKKSSTNNIFNQLLYWACNYFYESQIPYELKKQIYKVIKLLPQSTNLLSKETVGKLQLPRQYYAYSECFVLAKNLFLGNNGRMTVSERNKICGYAINMAKSFENMVCYYSRSTAYDLRMLHYSQASIRFAIASNSSDYDYFVRPDDIIVSDNKKLILDAKYKIIDGLSKLKPSREDFYQMISSCIAHNSNEAILIYPKTNGSTSVVWNVVEQINGKSIKIQTAFIDILDDDKNIKDVFTSIIKSTSFFMEVTK